MQTIQRWIVLCGTLLNFSAFVYSIYVKSVLYATIFLITTGYLAFVYRTRVAEKG
ncbi:hypothetical protein ATJ93_4515 [Halopiger aswanensis]|uniref:Uncharacterized protein n=1 Tax=Halopiger aswanensis TaxID=148449 RepID=A0A419VXX0_9EURY|nr:hypothetical protein ATJ93_4515 [Halopiger aswanensis]